MMHFDVMAALAAGGDRSSSAPAQHARGASERGRGQLGRGRGRLHGRRVLEQLLPGALGEG